MTNAGSSSSVQLCARGASSTARAAMYTEPNWSDILFQHCFSFREEFEWCKPGVTVQLELEAPVWLRPAHASCMGQPSAQRTGSP